MVQFSVSDMERYLEKIENWRLITSLPRWCGFRWYARLRKPYKHGIPLDRGWSHGTHFRILWLFFPNFSSRSRGSRCVVIQTFTNIADTDPDCSASSCAVNVYGESWSTEFLGIYRTNSPSYIPISHLDTIVAKLEKDRRNYLIIHRKIWNRRRQSSYGIYVYSDPLKN